MLTLVVVLHFSAEFRWPFFSADVVKRSFGCVGLLFFLLTKKICFASPFFSLEIIELTLSAYDITWFKEFYFVVGPSPPRLPAIQTVLESTIQETDLTKCKLDYEAANYITLHYTTHVHMRLLQKRTSLSLFFLLFFLFTKFS